MNYVVLILPVKCTCNKSIFRPPAEPVHGAARYQRWKLQSTVTELFPNGREAQNDMEIMSDA